MGLVVKERDLFKDSDSLGAAIVKGKKKFLVSILKCGKWTKDGSPRFDIEIQRLMPEQHSTLLQEGPEATSKKDQLDFPGGVGSGMNPTSNINRW